MSLLKTGTVQLGLVTAGIAMNNGDIMTFTHNQDQRAIAIICLSELGAVFANTDLSVTVNGPDDLQIQNNSGGPVLLRVLVIFEIASADAAGVVLQNDPRIAVA